MRVILEDTNELISFNLPSTVAGNYWICNASQDNLLNIISKDNKWFLLSNSDYKILKDINKKSNELLTNVNQLEMVEISNFLSLYIYEMETKKTHRLFFLPTYDNTISQLVIDIEKIKEIVIGKGKNSIINYNHNLFADKQLVITLDNGIFKVTNNNTNLNMFVNNILETEKILSSGDMVFIEELIFYLIGNIILINNPNNLVTIDGLKLTKRMLPNNPVKDYSTDNEAFVEVFNRSEYFQRPPRFKRLIEEKEYKIDPPTQGNTNNEDEMPLIYTLGPMMLMAITSLMSGFTAITNVISGKGSFKENATPIITTVSMLASMIVFPFLQKMWTKSNRFKKERKRRKKYKKYIEQKKEEILQEIGIQKQILIENNFDLENVAKIVLNKQRNLWERKLEHSDFLNIRLGIGSVKPKIKVNVPEEHFTMEEDNLKDVYNELFDTIKDIENVPVTINLVEKRIIGFVGNYSFLKQFLNGFMLQLMAFHSYDMLKIVVLTSNEKKDTWEKYRNLPHFWNNEKTFRYIGIDADGINKVSNVLMQKYNERLNSLEDNQDDNNEEVYKKFKDYYLIISDEVDYVKNTTIFNELIKNKQNMGFSFLLITEKIDKLPNECSTFVSLEEANAGIFETELISTKQRAFIPDVCNFNLNKCYLTLANIPVDIEAGKFVLPKTYSFLEMYNVGNVSQLNIQNRWKNNNILQSLSAPVGINEQGELFKIDLHENAHGPHGLVAGMTGSGKSEWIITYILSMCINYHPDEVQFVLIDYKGGGLAGTFENKETGIKIPHLVGTITNLDVNEINRSLASINSELKRRQALFNSARDKLGESSVDIYKYQKWYREGKIDEPISHLFIISDEFAELKSQQPEFMSELISTARIGRSLGVHLILATQKPSGVVDDQIWSNSKFRVCLKVQDKSDSNDMIRVPDAAYLKETGRFYLQVGYNEFFAKGQSAYAGSPYYESDRHKKVVDTDIVFVDNTGEVYKEINSDKKIVSAVYKGEELPNILKEIINVGNNTELHVKKLWLDAIPKNIYLNELLKKYHYDKQNFYLNPVIGEYDAPTYQKQNLLTLPLSEKGNTIIYGVSGSGKEMLISTLLYSLLTTYSYQEVNTYILDFGAEVFNCFKEAPIVGEIITANDKDKIKNFYKFIIDEFESRKKLFQDFGGSYYTYMSKSKEPLPIILAIINNFENYSEVVGDAFEEYLSKVTREGEKYGILFIVTVNNVNGINYRLSQNFKQYVCLQLKDVYDYKGILGTANRVIPASLKGRGLIDINGEAFEFQTALPVKTDDLSGFIEKLSLQAKAVQKGKAKIIKTLPEVINYEVIKNSINKLNDFPIGMTTESMEIYPYNFLNSYFNIITSNNSDMLNSFFKEFVSCVSKQKDVLKLIIFDANDFLEKVETNVTYSNNNFYTYLSSFNSFLDKVNEKTKQTLVVFTGFNKLLEHTKDINKILPVVLDKISKIDKFNVLFIDEVNDLDKSLKDYNKYLDLNNGIYIGNGIENQFLLDVKVTRDMRKEMPENFAYVIKKGKAIRIKILENREEEE